MFKRILLPSNLHSLDTPAVRCTLDLAERDKAAVMLLHVIEAIQGLDSGDLKEFYGMLERNALEKIEQLARTFTSKGITASTHVVIGSRARTIIEFAAKSNAEIIVLQSHRIIPEEGSGGWSTISYHVAVFAQCPVLLVK